MIKGRIFNIQRFSIHDGPGIRTIVFLKGCLMRCAWCSNPESQSSEIETMIEGGREKTVGRDVYAEELLSEILADRPYYRRSGGGVTLSGGESLCQAEFAAEILSLCRENGISTAMETTMNAPFEKIERLLPLVDLWLVDIKHMDKDKHKEYTAWDNTRILMNVRRAAEAGANIIVRTPVIPGFNDTGDEISQIARFAASLPGVREHHLLPFHRLGKDKYDGLGREYAFADTEPPSKEKMEYLRSVSEECGMMAQIGG